MISQASKLVLQDIRQKFSTIVRERKKETQLIVFQTAAATAAQKTDLNVTATSGDLNASLKRQAESPKADQQKVP